VEKKTVTVHKDLLSAFSFFDVNHCGYIEAKDLEEILLAVGPTLSRAYVKKIVSKVTTSSATKDTQVNISKTIIFLQNPTTNLLMYRFAFRSTIEPLQIFVLTLRRRLS